jgi:two-component system chemotaxis response regulator CheY
MVLSDTTFADMTALIIDDQEFVVNIVSKMMEQIGFGRIETAADGQAGLHAMVGVRPHVVLCDIEMRPMDGLTFLKELRDSTDRAIRDTPVIFLTSHGRHELVAQARALGADGFVTKPATVNLLRERIEQSIHSRAA